MFYKKLHDQNFFHQSIIIDFGLLVWYHFFSINTMSFHGKDHLVK